MVGDDHRDSTEVDEYRDWQHNLSALQDVGEELLEEWRQQSPQSPRDYPTTSWLNHNGYSHLSWILREKHDLRTREFFALLTSAGSSDGFSWAIGDVATIERVRAYLDDQADCRNWAESTRRTNRSRINEFFGRFGVEYGDDAFITVANDESVQSEAYDAIKDVVKGLRSDLTSDESAHGYLRAAHRFVEWLERSGRVAYDPMDGVEEEFRWSWSSDPQPLSKEQVKRLWSCAETDEQRMLVIGYCIWGLRTQELPAVHVEKVDLAQPTPEIRFDGQSRKNGEGAVSFHLGLCTLISLLIDRARNEEWNGHLFPSAEGAGSCLCARQMRRRFKALCREAGVTVDGEVATPKNGRTYHYNLRAKAESDLLEMAAKLARDQGASDAESVRDYYLTDEQRSRYRRIIVRERLRRAVPELTRSPWDEAGDGSYSLSDFE